MKLCNLKFPIGIITVFAFIHANDAISIQDVDPASLEKQAIDFLRPYTAEIQQWFWNLSGKRHPSQYQTIEPQADFVTCDVCTAALPVLKILIGFQVGDEIIIQVISEACKALDLAPRDDLCEPTIRSYAAPILYIVKNKPDMKNSDFCGILNPGCNGIPLSSSLTDWTIDIDTNKPQVVQRPPIPANANSTTILQFTDIHLDMDYKDGTNAACGLPTCCREGEPEAGAIGAGKFGHFGCELPATGVQALFDHAKANHPDTRYVFLTGDYIHSGVWLYSPEENGRHIRAVTTMLSNTFANMDVEIYPLTGNHEPDVVNMYPPPGAPWEEFPLGWMYEAVVEPFAQFLPQDQLDLFKKYGYYAVTPKNDPNLRIIALNTNICYINNFWLPYDAIDTFGQLKWFADQLDSAEKSNQRVLVIGHIQPGSSSCWPVWSNQFNRIINRYEAIIQGQFYGHSHEQYYTLAFEHGTDRPISLSFVGGSGVTDGMNSGYNVYEVDGERGADSTWEIMNHKTWILKLTESNENGNAAFEQILDSKTTFGIESMSPEGVYNFVYRMVCDDALFTKYQQVKVKGSDSPRYRPECINDRNCKASALSEIFVSNSGDHDREHLLQELVLNIDCSIPTTSRPTSSATDTTTNDPTNTGPTGPTSSEGNDDQKDNGSNPLQNSAILFVFTAIIVNIYI